MRKSKKRIRGTDRAIMMLCRDARRRWLQYGENRKNLNDICPICQKRPGTEIDHIIPLGPRPRDFNDDMLWWFKSMFQGQCVNLCKQCHKKKTDKERKRRKK